MQALRYEDELNSDYLPPLNLWLAVEPLLPQAIKTTKVGRKAKPDQQKKVANYKALLFLACAQVVWKRSIIFG